MKKSILATLTIILTACSTVRQAAVKQDVNNTIKVMTCNIRYANPDDKQNHWDYRKDRMVRAFKFYDPDIIGCQEVLHDQMAFLVSSLGKYASVGIGREDGKEKGEYEPIFYKKDRYALVDKGYFWLSETPEKAGSRGWDGACERMASWIKIKDKRDGKTYFVLNTHLDHVGIKARREGVTLILLRISTLAPSLPVIVTGDFNAEPQSDVIAHITDPKLPIHLSHTRDNSPLVYGPSWSFHDFGKIPYAERPLIDYVFTRNLPQPIKYGVLAETENESFISDHAPVMVTLQGAR